MTMCVLTFGIHLVFFQAFVALPLDMRAHGISTAAFSVMTSHITWSSCTRSPGFTCQATTSAETVPSPRSGILKT